VYLLKAWVPAEAAIVCTRLLSFNSRDSRQNLL
jgi:hypothetical protein